METVEKELAKGVGDEELGIALMWAASTGKVEVVSEGSIRALEAEFLSLPTQVRLGPVGSV